MEIEIHPITKILSAAIFLAVGVLIIPSPLIDAASAEPEECQEFGPPVCAEFCCDIYDNCIGVALAVRDDCLSNCDGNPSCEDDCEEEFEDEEWQCTLEADHCIDLFCI